MLLNQQRCRPLLLLTFIMWTAAICAPTLEATDKDPRITPLVRAVRHCQESVVNIHTEKTGRGEAESRFFSSKSRKVTGMGTGIVVDERGYIVTNYHVIQDVDQITVTLKDGEVLDARPVSFDRRQDMAIIQVNSSSPLTVMEMGISSDVLLAEQVFAVGNAFGYEHTVTAGIVSALGRDVEVDETQAYENLIQTDASINPGNSGGPLLNVLGEVIGINVAIRAGAQRIGFAIPIDDARRTIARLLSTERLNGVSHGVFSSDIREGNNKRLKVDTVAVGSAADRCGLQKGDLITSIRGIEIHDGADLERSLLDIPVGTVLDVDVTRGGKSVALKMNVGVGKAAVAPRNPVRTVSADTRNLSEVRQNVLNLLGMHLESLPTDDLRRLQKTHNGGLRVASIRTGSRAERHGIRVGDILLGLDGFETLDDRNLKFILQDSRVRRLETLSFQIHREGRGALVGHMDLRR